MGLCDMVSVDIIINIMYYQHAKIGNKHVLTSESDMHRQPHTVVQLVNRTQSPVQTKFAISMV